MGICEVEALGVLELCGSALDAPAPEYDGFLMYMLLIGYSGRNWT